MIGVGGQQTADALHMSLIFILFCYRIPAADDGGMTPNVTSPLPQPEGQSPSFPPSSLPPSSLPPSSLPNSPNAPKSVSLQKFYSTPGPQTAVNPPVPPQSSYPSSSYSRALSYPPLNSTSYSPPSPHYHTPFPAFSPQKDSFHPPFPQQCSKSMSLATQVSPSYHSSPLPQPSSSFTSPPPPHFPKTLPSSNTQPCYSSPPTVYTSPSSSYSSPPSGPLVPSQSLPHLPPDEAGPSTSYPFSKMTSSPEAPHRHSSPSEARTRRLIKGPSQGEMGPR